MANDVEKWREELAWATKFDDCRTSHDDAIRIALAAAEWRERLRANLYEDDHAACVMLNSIMRGEGPGHNPPSRGPDGQGECSQ